MRLRLMVMVLCTGVFVACKDNNGNGGNGDGGSDGGGGGNFAAITRTDTLPVGDATCANGGVKVHVGADNGDGGGIARDGILQDGEIDKTETICAQAPANTVTRQTVITAGGIECPFGGTKVEFGLDNGDGGGTAGDGILQDGERDGATNACASMPANLVVRTTPLFNGDPACPYGGTKVESGLDDGATPGDGILQDDEIDLTQNRCNPPPTDTFPAPTGPNGTNVIDISGGVGPGSGSTVGGGNGGQLTVANFAGPLAGSVEIHKNGAASPVAATSSATYTAGAGAAQLVITTNTEVPVVESAPETGLYVLGPTVAQGDKGLPLFNGATRVTSIKVQSGGTLRFKDLATPVPIFAVAIDGDIENEGTITAVANDGTSPANLTLYAHHVLNRAGGKVQAKRLALLATNGTDGEIVNQGEISTRGGDGLGSADASGDTMFLLAPKAITNATTGTITARGGDGDALATGSRGAGTVFAIAYAGSIRNGGTIDVSGGSGIFGAGGGAVFLWSGPVVPLLVASLSTFGQIPAAASAPPTTAGTYDIDSTGSFDSRGGDGLGSANGGGAGGEIVVISRGGDIRANGTWTATGGAGTASQSGEAGSVLVHASTLLLANGAPLVPGEITLGTSINARGGSGTGLSHRGGNGGSVSVTLDAMLQFENAGVGSIGYSTYNPAQFLFTNFDRSLLSQLAVKPRVQLLGVQNINATGGSSTQSGAGGNGGSFGLVAATCVDTCAFSHVKTHYVLSSAPVDVSGGAGAYTTSGIGGFVELLEFGGYGNQIAATVDAARVDVKGNLTGKGGASTFTANAASESNLIAATGDVTIDGNLDFTGGASTGGMGGRGGRLSLNGFVVTVNGDVTLSGGAGTPAGSSDALNSFAYRTQWNGDLVATGSTYNASHRFFAGQAINLAGSINLSGSGASMGSAGQGAPGGGIEWSAPTMTNTGSITSVGADFAGANGRGGTGGYLNVYGGTWTKTGAVTLDGGGCTGVPCLAGNGGYLYVEGNATGTGTVWLKGGSTTAAGAMGGEGGTVELYRGLFGVSCDLTGGASTNGQGGHGGQLYGESINTAAQTLNGGSGISGGSGGGVEISGNTGAITLNGGSGTTGSGGDGGAISVDDQNTGAVSANGGSSASGAGGDGGRVYFYGTNSVCASVDGGTGTPAGASGTVTGPNMCGT